MEHVQYNITLMLQTFRESLLLLSAFTALSLRTCLLQFPLVGQVFAKSSFVMKYKQTKLFYTRIAQYIHALECYKAEAHTSPNLA
jgi:hypothetical protein